MSWWTSIKSFFADLIREPEKETPMGIIDELKDLYPDGIPVEVEDEILLTKVKDAGERLSDEDFAADKAALDKAISANEKIKVYLAVAKMATSLGMKFI